MARKLGRPTKERMHILRNQASELLWYGRIETTVDRAKEVRRIAEKMVTLAVNTFEDEVESVKQKTNLKNEKVDVVFKNDGPKKLVARRKMMSVLRDIQEVKEEKESKTAYKERTREINHPLIEKLFREYAPKYAARNAELSKGLADENAKRGGGYTRIIKLGARRGDNAEMAILEMI